MQWESLNLIPREYLAYDAGPYRTVEAAGARVVGIPKRGKDCTTLGDGFDQEEARVVALMLRVLMQVAAEAVAAAPRRAVAKPTAPDSKTIPLCQRRKPGPDPLCPEARAWERADLWWTANVIQENVI